MFEEFKKFISEKSTIEKSVEEILSNMKNVKNKSSFELDFKLEYGKLKNESGNTFVKFDTDEGSTLKEILNFISDPNKNPTDDVIAKFNSYLSCVSVLLESKSKIIREKIREELMNGASEEVFPMKDIRVVGFFLEEKPEIDFVLSVQKSVPKGAIDSYQIGPDLMADWTRTKEDVNEIIKRKKLTDDRYKYVDSATMTKGFYECEIIFFVDYTPQKIKTAVLED